MALRRRSLIGQAEPGTWVRRLGPPDTLVLDQLARDNPAFGMPGERPELAPLSTEDSKKFLDDDRTIALVAFNGDDPVGFLYACELYRRHTNLSHLCIYEVGVADQYRDHGIGSALMEELAIEAHKRGISQGFAITNQVNRAAIDLFKSVGGMRSGDDDVLFVLRF